MAKHVISTLSADTRYAQWVNNAGINTIERSVLVRGGAGIATGTLVTPDGVRTEVSDDDARFLSEHGLFKEHQESGHVKIVSIAKDPDSVAQSMSKDEGSRPRNEGDIANFTKKMSKDEKIQAVTNRR